MSASEFETWVEFYKMYPFDDLHRYHRPHALLAAVTGGGEVGEYIEWLQPDRAMEGMTDADRATMRALGYTRKGGE
jgi:hypothetical protein